MVHKPALQLRRLPWILIALILVSVASAGCGQTAPPRTPAPSIEPAPAVGGKEESRPPVKETAELAETIVAQEEVKTTLKQQVEVSKSTDTTPPPEISGLAAVDAYDGKVNLIWQKSTVEDFGHYNIYVSKSEMADVSGMTPIYQVNGVDTNTYQVTGLEPGTRYYFAVTSIDKTGNENRRVTCVSVTTTPMPRGTTDPGISVEIYESEKAWPGTTLLPFNYTPGKSRIIELNMLGEIIWEYQVPRGHVFDAELLPNNNILFMIDQEGVYEVNRKGDVVWSYLDKKVSHDADRLPNGNTLIVWGFPDGIDDAQVKEINPKGEVVWAWYAKGHFNKPPYNSINEEGWTHTNAVQRLPNGNTLISLRNFHFVVEVDAKGSVLRTIGEGILDYQHDPEILPNGNLIAATHNQLPEDRGKPQRAIEIDPKTGSIIWQFPIPGQDNWPVRDANRLPNGNTLITGLNRIVEVTPQKEIIWRLTLKEVVTLASGRGFYKAERVNALDR